MIFIDDFFWVEEVALGHTLNSPREIGRLGVGFLLAPLLGGVGGGFILLNPISYNPENIINIFLNFYIFKSQKSNS